MKLQTVLDKLEKRFDFQYKVIPSRIGTLRVAVDLGLSQRKIIIQKQIKFPKSLFIINWGDRPITYAINEKDEICHQPFYNISEAGSFCVYNNQTQKLISSIDDTIDTFYGSPFIWCTDVFSTSIKKYQIIDYDNFNKMALIPVPDEYFKNV